jgi:hypothetical protein
MEKLSGFVRVDLVPMRRTSVLLLLSLRKLQVNQDFISCRQSEREVGGRVEVGLVDM